MDSNQNIAQPSIKIVELTKRYDNRISVDKLNIEIYPGEIYSLLGENGAKFCVAPQTFKITSIREILKTL